MTVTNELINSLLADFTNIKLRGSLDPFTELLGRDAMA